MMRKTGCLILFISAFFFVRGQEKNTGLNGIITGVVMADSTGKVIENATVSIKNLTSQSVFDLLSDKQGYFEFLNLPEG